MGRPLGRPESLGSEPEGGLLSQTGQGTDAASRPGRAKAQARRAELCSLRRPRDPAPMPAAAAALGDCGWAGGPGRRGRGRGGTRGGPCRASTHCSPASGPGGPLRFHFAFPCLWERAVPSITDKSHFPMTPDPAAGPRQSHGAPQSHAEQATRARPRLPHLCPGPGLSLVGPCPHLALLLFHPDS